jgi:hypothetical protein
MPSRDPARDAAARTRLGRQRSSLALVVVAGLLVHEGRPLGLVSGLLLAAAAAWGWGRRTTPAALTALAVAAAVAAAAVTLGV